MFVCNQWSFVVDTYSFHTCQLSDDYQDTVSQLVSLLLQTLHGRWKRSEVQYTRSVQPPDSMLFTVQSLLSEQPVEQLVAYDNDTNISTLLLSRKKYISVILDEVGKSLSCSFSPVCLD